MKFSQLLCYISLLDHIIILARVSLGCETNVWNSESWSFTSDA